MVNTLIIFTDFGFAKMELKSLWKKGLIFGLAKGEFSFVTSIYLVTFGLLLLRVSN